jgi:hypothetical protein
MSDDLPGTFFKRIVIRLDSKSKFLCARLHVFGPVVDGKYTLVVVKEGAVIGGQDATASRPTSVYFPSLEVKARFNRGPRIRRPLFSVDELPR